MILAAICTMTNLLLKCHRFGFSCLILLNLLSHFVGKQAGGVSPVVDIERATNTTTSGLNGGFSKQTLRVWLICLCTTYFESRKSITSAMFVQSIAI